MLPDLSPLEAADDPTIDAAVAVLADATAADLPDFPPPCPYVFRGRLTFPQASLRREKVVARLDGAVVGLLELDLPMRDNLENAELELTVHPAYRRRGVGRALHAYAMARLADLGRKRYATYVLADSAGSTFAAAMGAKVAQQEVRRRLDLTTVDEPALAALQRAAEEKSTGYRLVSFVDRTPEEYVADVAYLIGRFNTDAPQGDLQVEPEQLDSSRIREQEESLAACQQRIYTSGAVHAESGRMVALSTIARSRSTPWHASQWITLVDRAHRGHRLGALTKVGNLSFARAHEPEVTTIDTWNAAENAHMIAINEEMGFRVADSWSAWQQEI